MIREHNITKKEVLCIYTNASVINGYIDTTAIVLDQIYQSHSTRRTAYIDKLTILNIYAAELRGIEIVF